MVMKIRPEILCGGQGTRLWPISRTNYPKQFIPVINGKSLFDLTINRIKKITLNPKSKISKQFHNFRSEHWFITKGRGEVFKNDKIIKIKKGESIDIPKKCIHYIENKTIHSLSFVEIQMGSYFGEDDIFRIDDIYGRK